MKYTLVLIYVLVFPMLILRVPLERIKPGKPLKNHLFQPHRFHRRRPVTTART